jgi:hypothetical protein
MIWTPFQINIILHYHCSVGPFSGWRAPIFPETVDELVAEGLLVAKPDDGLKPVELFCFDTTPRGKALVGMWCATPLPEHKFVDPRFEMMTMQVDWSERGLADYVAKMQGLAK